MSAGCNNEIRELLKKSLSPVDYELHRDLWPGMLHRLDQGSSPFATVPWFDWALIGSLFATICAFPSSIPLLLYHL